MIILGPIQTITFIPHHPRTIGEILADAAERISCDGIVVTRGPLENYEIEVYEIAYWFQKTPPAFQFLAIMEDWNMEEIKLELPKHTGYVHPESLNDEDVPQEA